MRVSIRVHRAAMTLSWPFLLASSAQAISTRTLITLTGQAAGDQYGLSVSRAGDVNGDGFEDVIVGANANDAGGADAGRAYVHYGGPSADALADLTFTGVGVLDNFGISVSEAGDVNGDGFGDVIVGADRNDFGGLDAGRAYVYYGGPSPDAVADLTLTGAAVSDGFGHSVSAAGDLNGDGFGELIVGAWLNDSGGAEAGRAYVYYGGPSPDTVADLTLTGAAAGDRLGVSVGAAGDVNGDGFGDVIVGGYQNDAGGADAGRAYVYYGGPSADTVADLTLTGAAVGDNFGFHVSEAGDVNGDGFGDVIVGAHQNDAGGANAGRAYVYYGGADANAVADLTFTGAAVGDLFGQSVSDAGDVNGDGFGDLVVGAYFNDAGGADAGRAYVYLGGPSADALADLLFTGAATIDFFGYAVSAAGDVNGDGFGELIVGAWGNDAGGGNAGRAYVTAVFPYEVLSPNGGEQWVAGEPVTVRWRGHDVADLALSYDGGATWDPRAAGIGGLAENEYSFSAPDVASPRAKVRMSYNGQAVSHATSDESDGVFRIVLPARAAAVAAREQLAPTGAAAADFFGSSVGTAGDVNGDGHADLIVGAPLNAAGGPSAGRAYVFHGGPLADTVPELTLTGAAAGDFFANAVATAGDVNGDGYADVIVGASQNDAGGLDAGRAYVYYGGPGADATPDLTLTGAAAGDLFGVAVGTAGDVNGDGFADLIVGARNNDAGGANAGRAYVYHGGAVPDPTPDLILTGAVAGDLFGFAVATAGDVNGDGYADVIVGTPFNDGGGTDAGRAYIYYGGPGADATADLTLTGQAGGDELGYSVASAGDANGDGFDDVIVGADRHDAGVVNTGAAYVYFGGPGVDATADVTLAGVTLNGDFGYSVGSAGDVNGDGFDDLIVGSLGDGGGGIDAGKAFVYLGGPLVYAQADITLAGEAAGDLFSLSVGAAGDVNGDGFADLIVGAPNNDAGGADAGKAYLYDLHRYFVLGPGGGETWNVGAMRSIAWLGAEPADVWLSVDGGRTFDLLLEGAGGAELNEISIRVPHAPTKYARVKVSASDPALVGENLSDSLFTIQSTVALLAFEVEPAPAGEAGVTVRWQTDPGPENLAGYRLERDAAAPAGAGGWTTIVSLTRELAYHDAEAVAAPRYRLFAVNGLGEELLLGDTGARIGTPLAAWPLPYRGGALTISFATAAAPGGAPANSEVALYDVSGRRVRQIAGGSYATGRQLASWDGTDAGGRPVPPGVYFLRSTSGAYVHTVKLSVVR